MNIKYVSRFLGVIVLVLVAYTLDAQCAMCKAAVESGNESSGLNTGILYLLLTPYLLVMTLLFLWWRNKKRTDDEVQEVELRDLLNQID